MQIQKTSSTTFTSLKNPIPTTKILTELGEVTLREALSTDVLEIAKAIRTQQSISYKCKYFYGKPKGFEEQREAYRSMNRNSWLKDIKARVQEIMGKKDGKSSILVARDENDKLIGFATMESDKNNNNVGVIEYAHIDYHYHNTSIAPNILTKLIDSARGQFDYVCSQVYRLGFSNIFQRFGFYKAKPEAGEYLELNYSDGIRDRSADWVIKSLKQ